MRDAVDKKAAADKEAAPKDTSSIAEGRIPSTTSTQSDLSSSMSEDVAKMMLRQAQERISDLEEQVARLEQARQRHQDENKGLNKELGDASGRTSALNERITELEKLDEELHERISELEMLNEKLNEKAGHYETLSRQLKERVNELEVASGQLHATNREMEVLIMELHESVQESQRVYLNCMPLCACEAAAA